MKQAFVIKEQRTLALDNTATLVGAMRDFHAFQKIEKSGRRRNIDQLIAIIKQSA